MQPKQLDLIMGTALMNGTLPNEHGVFESGYEEIVYQQPKKPWHFIEIGVGLLNNGEWISCLSCHTGNSGMGYGLWLNNSGRYKSRGLAILARLNDVEKRFKRQMECWSTCDSEKGVITKMTAWIKEKKEVFANE